MRKNSINTTLVSLVLAAGATSCSTIQNTAHTEDVATRIVNLTMADIEVSADKATSTTSWSWNPFNTVSTKEIKENASAQLLREHNADVLVEPQYEVMRRGLFRGGSVTVTGYPATYKGFRPMNETDAAVISQLNGQRVIITETATTNTTGPTEKPYVKKVRNTYRPYKFLNIEAGPSFGGSLNNYAFNLALMFGSYSKSSWGWYARANFNWLMESNKQYGGYVSGGAMKAFSNRFGVFVGTGFGMVYCGSRDTGIGMPVEGGFQIRCSDRFNFNAGLTYSIPLDNADPDEGTFSPFIGLGINF